LKTTSYTMNDWRYSLLVVFSPFHTMSNIFGSGIVGIVPTTRGQTSSPSNMDESSFFSLSVWTVCGNFLFGGGFDCSLG